MGAGTQTAGDRCQRIVDDVPLNERRQEVEAGFGGWISIEDGMDGMGQMKASVDYLKQLRTRYYPDD